MSMINNPFGINNIVVTHICMNVYNDIFITFGNDEIEISLEGYTTNEDNNRIQIKYNPDHYYSTNKEQPFPQQLFISIEGFNELQNL